MNVHVLFDLLNEKSSVNPNENIWCLLVKP